MNQVKEITNQCAQPSVLIHRFHGHFHPDQRKRDNMKFSWHFSIIENLAYFKHMGSRNLLRLMKDIKEQRMKSELLAL